jgi:hypothetical protein
MAFDLSLTTGKRDDAGGPLTRLSGSFGGMPTGTAQLNLMITDCKVVRRIKKLNVGATKDAAFSLVASDLASACSGLDASADWHVFGQTTDTPPSATSSGIQFPAGKKGTGDSGVDIKKLKKDLIAKLNARIRGNTKRINALDRLGAPLERYAFNPDNIETVAELLGKASRTVTSERAKLAKENAKLERERDKRQAQLEKQFGAR